MGTPSNHTARFGNKLAGVNSTAGETTGKVPQTNEAPENTVRRRTRKNGRERRLGPETSLDLGEAILQRRSGARSTEGENEKQKNKHKRITIANGGARHEV